MASRRSTPKGHAARASRQLRHEFLEKRELLAAEIAGPRLISVAANSGENFNLLANNQLSVAPQQLTFRFSGGQEIDPSTLSAIRITGSGGDGDFTNGNETQITPGYIGLGDSTRIVIARFSSDLPDDQYRVSISGFDQTELGQVSLRNTLGERFQAANPPDAAAPSQELFFNIELGAKVVAVVPQPVTGTGAARVQQRDQIYVYFNNDPLTNPSAGPVTTTGNATDPTVVQPKFYNLFVTKDTVESGDDGAPIQPSTITYDPDLRRATLTFPGGDLSAIPAVAAAGGSATLRLRIGSSLDSSPQSLPVTLAPFSGDLTADIGGTFADAQPLPIPGTGFGGGSDSSIVVSGDVSPTIGNTIQWPGIDSPGVRDDRRDAQVVGRADTNDGVNEFFYNFANLYGTDAGGNDLENAITPAQKQRAREILDLYSRQLGVQFIETENRGLQIVTGDMRALVEGATTGPGAPFQEYRVNDLDPSQGVLILDAAEPWYDGYGLSPDSRPSWFTEAIRGIGNLLGLGPTFEQVPGVASGSNPSLYNASLFGVTGNFSIEPDFLSSSDIIPLRALHRREIKDADLYSFSVTERGRISVETYAQRMLDTSNLDTDLKLWKLNSSTGTYEIVARNNDFYGNDSFIGIDVDRNADGSAATYVIGITANGNNDYNPNIAGSGGGGLSQGRYDMRVSFESSTVGTILDTNGSRLDGDSDGQQGGDFNFWFRTAKTKDSAAPGEVRTLFVNSGEGVDAVTSGTVTTPYRTIQYALAQSSAYATSNRPGQATQDVIRLLGDDGLDNVLSTTADNLAYEIGTGGSGNLPLKDGQTFEVPKGVTVMIDAGAILKLRNAKISVGSQSIDQDRSLAALQILGEPLIIDSREGSPTFGQPLTRGSVQITSYNEERRDGVLIGQDNNPIPTAPAPGDWAGIEFRNDVDYSEGRSVWETEGIFLDYVSHANIRYGGGSVTLTDPAVAPLQMFESRPTLIYNHIGDSRQAALSADPDSFEETNFNAPIYQQASIDRFGTTFASDYDRVGPLIRGNLLERNSVNGLFVRVETPALDVRKPLTTSARFDDRDIVHVFSEVLVLQGNPGGPQALEQRPDVLNVNVGSAIANPVSLTPLAAGRVVDYRLTFVTADGIESLASDPTRNFTVDATGAVALSNLPAAPAEFAGRRLYRLTATGTYEFVAQLDRATSTFRDNGATRGGLLSAASLAATTGEKLLPRINARLSVDPGLVLKLDTARIEATFGADFYAEGTDGNPVVFTSRRDDRFGAGGTFDTNNDGFFDQNDPLGPQPGNWSGLVFRQGATASIDNAIISFAGGESSVGGGFEYFNPIEILQADVRIAHSTIADNASGTLNGGTDYTIRDGVGFNGAATIFVRGAQPVIVDNIITDNGGAAISINPDALNYVSLLDGGRSTGVIDRFLGDADNQGPLIEANRLDGNDINGMLVRNEALTTESVWDDTDVVHVVEGNVYAWNHHHRSSLRLKSDPNQSLVVKLQSGGALIADRYRSDVSDGIGGTIQVLGQAGFPVVLTSLSDDTVGAGFTPSGEPQNDTDGILGTPAAGDWRGIVINSGSNDRNVAFIPEAERAIGTASGINAIPSTAQIIGSLARNEVSADENRRLGFNIRGTLSQNSDIDVYKFTANGGTEVYIDIDDTDFGLDTVVELIDINGNILALSNNSASEITVLADPSNPLTLTAQQLYRGPSMPAGSVLPLYKTGKSVIENPNPLDAGMRVILPGNTTVNEYYIRVRSSNLRAGDEAGLVIPGQRPTGAPATDPVSSIRDGRTSGQYQLSLRLRETDEIAGTTVRLADIRYATTAIDVPAAPNSSPLVAEHAEELTESGLDLNNNPQTADGARLAAIQNGTATTIVSAATADPLGSLNASDRAVLRVSGELGNQVPTTNLVVPDYFKEFDVDFYAVDILAENQAPNIIDENRFVSATFDLDFADQFGGPNTSIAVYRDINNIGGNFGNPPQLQLILHSRDSNVADDQGRPTLGNDPTNLAAGSAGTLDAYIGPVELQVGRYYVAVSSAQMIPAPLDQLFETAPLENGVRILPIDSTRRVAEWGFEEDFLAVNNNVVVTATDEVVSLNTAADLPTIRPLFDDTSIVPYKLEDVRLFLTLQGGLTGNNQTTVISVDPFTGQLERTIGEFGPEVGDLAIRRDGELFSYSHRPNQPNAGNTGNYLNVSSADGSAANAGDDGLTYNRNNQAGTGTENDDNGFLEVNAMSFIPVASTVNSLVTPGNNPAINDNERFYAVGNRTSIGRGELPEALRNNIIYSMVANGGAATNQGSTNGQLDRNFGNTPYIEPFGPGSNKQELGIIDTGQFADSPIPPDGNYTQFDAGGNVTGIALDPVGQLSEVFAVTDNGYLYSFNPNSRRTVDVENDAAGGLFGSYNRVINTVNFGQVPAHPDDFSSFNGVNFQSLTFGPRNTELGRFENVLFGITGNGWLYAFTANTVTGRVEPAPILFNGNYALQLVDDDGLTLFEQPTGMAFSTRQETLWHTTGDFASPFGNPDPNAHGVFIGHNQTRIRTAGGSSLYFGNEIDATTNNNTLDGGNGVLNPGGVHGTTVSAPFSLEGYASADKPTLYFTYLLETQDDSDYSPLVNNPPRRQTDSFRVFAAGDDGQWRLVSTNNTWRAFSNTPFGQTGGDGVTRGDEYDFFATNGGIPVQELFDQPAGANSTDWRQARVDLSPLAGNKSVQLRFDFSTAGGMQSQNRVTGYLTELQVTPGTEIIDGSTFTLQDTSSLFGVGTTQTFEFVRGAAFTLPAGNVLLDGQTITVVDTLGGTTTLTLTTDPASLAINPVLFSRSDSANVIAAAVANALDAIAPNLLPVATGAGIRIPEAASFSLVPQDFGAAALTVPDANPDLVGRSLTFTSEIGRATTITLQTEQQISFGFGAEQIQLIADNPGTADSVRVQFLDTFNPLLPPADPVASAAYNPTTRLITVSYNSDPAATPTNNDFDAVVFALNNIFSPPGSPTFTATLSNGNGTVAFTPPFTTPTFAADEVYFTLADTADVIVSAISAKLSQIDPSLIGAFGQGSIIIPTDLTLIDFSSLTFTNQLGATTQVTPVDIPGNFGGGFVSYSSVNDTPATLAQRLAARINLLDPTLGAVAVGSGISVPGAATSTLGFGYIAGSSSGFGGDQLVLTGAVNVPITVPADLTDPALDGATLTFITTAGNSTTLTLTTSAPTPGQIQYDPLLDTPALLAQRIAQRIRTASGFALNTTTVGDQINVTGARGIALHPAFSNGTINLGTLNVGTTAEGFLPSGNVPINYSEGMTNVEVRDAVRDALARGIGTVSTAGISQATTANFPEYGTQRIRLFNQSVVSNSTVVGVSSYLPGDEFGTAVSAGVSNGFRNTRPGQGNDIQGIYIDDIVIGFAERGEVVYNAPTNNSTFVVLPETRSDTFQDDQQPEFLDEQLVGQYTLEIRTSAEYGVPEDYDPIRLQLDEQFGLGRSFDTNDRLNPEAVTLIAPRGVDLIDGDVFVLSNGSQTLTFEFDSNSSVVNGRVRVPFTPGFDPSDPGSTYSPAADDATAVARAIRDAINSTQAFGVLGIYAASTDSRDAGAMSGNRVELFGNSIQVNPTSGRFSKVDLVAEETFYGRETARVIPAVDHANQTVIDAIFPNTFARATTTNFINGTTDTLVAVGKIGDNVLTRDGGGEIVYNNGISGVSILPASGVVNNNGNALIPTNPESDFDIVKIYLQAGDVIDVDLDTTGWNLGTEFTDPVLAIFGDVAGSDPQLEAVTQVRASAPGERHASAFLDDFAAPRSGYYYVLVAAQTLGVYGEYQLNIRPASVTSNGVAIPGDVLMVDYHLDHGDTNVNRPQGQYIIESNFISDFATTGILAGFGNANTDEDNFFSSTPSDRRPGAAATLRNPNTQRLVPGTVISNNVIVANGGTAIAFTGETAAGGNSPAPVPFGRIVNNTVVGSGAGLGIQVGQSAAPTVLNNIVTGFATGVSVAGDSTSTVEGGNAYQNNAVNSDRPIAASSIVIASGQTLFQDAAGGVYIPAAGSAVIDSSFASLGDRTNFVNTVKQPVGISASPIIAPVFDALGIPRFDDPTVATPSGVGSNVFIDRGAIDRADFVRPIADLAAPLDFVPGGVSVSGGDIDPSRSFVRLTAGSVRFFEIQLFDPSGSGPDPRTITEDSVILTENGVRLLPGVDYTFGYSANSRLARLTPLGGLWRTDAVYDITLNNQNRVGLDLPAGDEIADGSRYAITDSANRTSVFEFDSGYVLQVPQTLGIRVLGPNTTFVDGETFTVSFADSTGTVTASRTFEINRGGTVRAGNVPVNIGSPDSTDGISVAPTIQSVRDALLTAINSVSLELGLATRGIGSEELQIGSAPGHSITGTVTGLEFFGVAAGVAVGDQFRYSVAGGSSQLFEFTNAGGTPTSSSAIAIEFARTMTVDEVAENIADAVANSSLGLASARRIDNGQVLLGGKPTDTLTIVGVDNDLQIVGTAGVTGKLTITVPTGTTPAALEGSTFVVRNGSEVETFQFTSVTPLPVTSNRLIVLGTSDSESVIAQKIASTIDAGIITLAPTSSVNMVSLNERDALNPVQVLASVTLGTTPLVLDGVSGGAIPVSFIPTSSFSSQSSAASLVNAIQSSPLVVDSFSPGGGTLLFTGVQGITLTEPDGTVSTVGEIIPAISDLAGNPVASNRDDNETRFTIIMPEVRFDFGDAPNSYGTSLATDGARHALVGGSTLRLGQFVDGENDASAFPFTDDQEVSLNIMSSTASITVDSSVATNPQVTIDAEPASRDFVAVTVGPQTMLFEFILATENPSTGRVGVVFAPGEQLSSIAQKLLTAIRSEFAETAVGSVFYTIDPATPTTLSLRSVDDEDGISTGLFTPLNGTPLRVFTRFGATAPISADDVTGFINPLDPAGTNFQVAVLGTGLLDVFVDFNLDGDFNDPGEQALRNAPVTDGINTLTFFTPAGAIDGDTWMRLRVSEGGNLGPNGVAIGGEVEDHPVTIRSIVAPNPVDDIGYTTVEDVPLDTNVDVPNARPSVIANDSGLNTQLVPQKVFVVTPPANGTVVLDADTGDFVYTPNPAFNGDDEFTYRIGPLASGTGPTPVGAKVATVSITVTAVNDPPTFTVQSTNNILEDEGAANPNRSVVIPGVITDLEPGRPEATDETGQTITLSVNMAGSNVPTGLMSQPAQIDASGNLTVFPAADAYGTAIYQIVASDDGLPVGSGVSTTLITVNVRPVNDPPRPNLTRQGETNGSGADNVYTIANGTTSPGPNLPATTAAGTLVYTLKEDGGPFFIPLRQQPSGASFARIGLLDPFLAGPANETAPHEGGPQQVQLSRIDTETVANGTLTPVFDPASPSVLIGYNYTPRPDFNSDFGSFDSFTYEILDQNGNVASDPEGYLDADGVPVDDPLRSTNQVILIINPVNDTPLFTIPTASVTVQEDAAVLQQESFAINISAGPPQSAFDEVDLDPSIGQTVDFTVTSLSFPQNQSDQFFTQYPSISRDGTLRFQAAPDVFGSFQFEVVLTDNGVDNSVRGDDVSSDPVTITINVLPVNDVPGRVPGVNDLAYTINEDTTRDILVRGTAGAPGLLDLFNVGPANESADISPLPGGNQTIALDTFPASTTNGGTLTPIMNQAGAIVSLQYRPRANYVGTDSFIYGVIDNGSTVGLDGVTRPDPRQSFATVSFTVNPVNDAPLFSGGSNVVSDEDPTPATTTVANWATNIQAGPLGADDELSQLSNANFGFVFTQIAGPTNLFSTLPQANIVGSNANLVYTAAPDANGVATFAVFLRDGGPAGSGNVDRSETQTFTIRVNAVNDPPTFVPGSPITILEDSGAYRETWATNVSPGPADEQAVPQTVSFDVTADAASQALFQTQPTIDSNGILQFLPASNASGTATLSVRAIDSAGGISAPVTLVINITEVNDPPSAVADSFDTDEDTVFTITAAQLRANDVDPDLLTNPNEVLTVVMPAVQTSISGAVVRFDATTGVITYDPRSSDTIQSLAPGQSLRDSFAYRLRDAAGLESVPVTVGLNVAGINDAPRLVDDTPTLNPSGATIIEPLVNDTDIDGTINVSSLEITLQPAFGSLSITGEGVLTYTPFSTFAGEDVFKYTVRDNLGLVSPEATVTISSNAAPIARPDAAGTFLEEEVEINVAENDSDPDGSLNLGSVVITTQPLFGTAIPQSNGTVRYVPGTSFTGLDSFKYTIADDQGRRSQPTTVRLQVVGSRLQNPAFDRTADVNADGTVSAIDALLIINRLNLAQNEGNTSGSIPVLDTDQGPAYFDVTGDKRITALDALAVLNTLNQRDALGQGSAELTGGQGELFVRPTNPSGLASDRLELPTVTTTAKVAEPSSTTWWDGESDVTGGQLADDDVTAIAVAMLSDSASKDSTDPGQETDEQTTAVDEVLRLFL